ncbi:MAG TPA: hypothetical protein VI299_08720 [Polyangiales bacterium]
MTAPLDDDTLQRFYDGDLSPLEEHRVQACIEADPQLQDRLAELAQLTEVMRRGTRALGQGLDSQALFAAIEGELEKPSRVGLGARLRVVSSEWTEHRRSALVAIGGATAVAAATLLAVLRPEQHAPSHDGSLVLAPGEEQQPIVPYASEPVHGSSVENVDFGANTGTVFELDNEGVAVAVVWISDDEEP